jgi:hypothetical protein
MQLFAPGKEVVLGRAEGGVGVEVGGGEGERASGKAIRQKSRKLQTKQRLFTSSGRGQIQ